VDAVSDAECCPLLEVKGTDNISGISDHPRGDPQS